MDYRNNIVLDEDIFINKSIPFIELTEDQRKRLDDGQSVELLDGSIMISIPMKACEDK